MTIRHRSFFVLFVALSVILTACSGSSTPGSSSSPIKCNSRSACENVLGRAGGPSIAQLQAPDFRLLVGYFYPRSTANSTWASRLQFEHLPSGATLEEDVSPFGHFRCNVTAGIQVLVTTPGGRTACYLASGASSELRYGQGNLLYKFYLLPPLHMVGNISVQSLLEAAVDSLR